MEGSRGLNSEEGRSNKINKGRNGNARAGLVLPDLWWKASRDKMFGKKREEINCFLYCNNILYIIYNSIGCNNKENNTLSFPMERSPSN